jgi:Tfp pilus assembly protein PilV
MSNRRREQRGETLVEICITLVLIGAIVGAFFAAYSTMVNASTSHRDLVTADTALRDYAEATKAAVRSDCTAVGATYDVSYTPPSGFTVNSLTGQTCPSTDSTQQVDLSVTMPNGSTKTLTIAVRTS